VLTNIEKPSGLDFDREKNFSVLLFVVNYLQLNVCCPHGL
jgi:hypothetical protein